MIVRCYDVMDTVIVSVLISEQENQLSTRPDWVPLVQESFSGVGQEDPRKWARDALMHCAEAL